MALADNQGINTVILVLQSDATAVGGSTKIALQLDSSWCSANGVLEPRHVIKQSFVQSALLNGNGQGSRTRSMRECSRYCMVPFATDANMTRARRLGEKLTTEGVALVAIQQPHTICIIAPCVVDGTASTTRMCSSQSSYGLGFWCIVVRLLHAKSIDRLSQSKLVNTTHTKDNATRRDLGSLFRNAFEKQRDFFGPTAELLAVPFDDLAEVLLPCSGSKLPTGVSKSIDSKLKNSTRCFSGNFDLLKQRMMDPIYDSNAPTVNTSQQSKAFDAVYYRRLVGLTQRVPTSALIHVRTIDNRKRRREVLPVATGVLLQLPLRLKRRQQRTNGNNSLTSVAKIDAKDSKLIFQEANVVSLTTSNSPLEAEAEQYHQSLAPFWRAPVEGTRSHSRDSASMCYDLSADSKEAHGYDDAPPSKRAKRFKKPEYCSHDEVRSSNKSKAQKQNAMEQKASVPVDTLDASLGTCSNQLEAKIDCIKPKSRRGCNKEVREALREKREYLCKILEKSVRENQPVRTRPLLDELQQQFGSMDDSLVRRLLMQSDFVSVSRGVFVPLMATPEFLARLSSSERVVLAEERKRRKMVVKIIRKLLEKKQLVRIHTLERLCLKYKVLKGDHLSDSERYYLYHIMHTLAMQFNATVNAWVQDNDNHNQPADVGTC